MNALSTRPSDPAHKNTYLPLCDHPVPGWWGSATVSPRGAAAAVAQTASDAAARLGVLEHRIPRSRTPSEG
jgi:hypothetical protein